MIPDPKTFLDNPALLDEALAGGDIAPFLALHAGLVSPAFTVDEFSLYESRLGHAGSSYHAVETYRADGHPGVLDD
jgi:2'-5' RNA ligase